MTTKSNLHTHCTYCDGKNTIDEMIRAAIAAGFESIGFSSHSPTGYEFDQCQVTDIDGYFNELESEKRKYEGIIDVFKGMELESRVVGETRPVIDPRCDYTLGGLHLFRTSDSFYEVDYTVERWLEALDAFGSVKALVENYLEELSSFAEQVNFDIIAHMDLYTKFNGDGHLFDEDEKWLKDMAIHYTDRLAKTGKIFEVNTGAMSRNYRSIPYPTRYILKRILQLKAPIIISSDSHKVQTICYAFDETEKMLKDMGFKEQMRLTKNGFVSVPL